MEAGCEKGMDYRCSEWKRNHTEGAKGCRSDSGDRGRDSKIPEKEENVAPEKLTRHYRRKHKGKYSVPVQEIIKKKKTTTILIIWETVHKTQQHLVVRIQTAYKPLPFLSARELTVSVGILVGADMEQ